MASGGYTGYTVQQVVYKGQRKFLCFGPKMSLVDIGDVKEMIEVLMAQMIERKDYWRWWWEQPLNLEEIGNA